MRFKRIRVAVVAGAMGLLLSPSTGGTQGVGNMDVRLVRPVVMLLLDTSGSMEWMPGQDGVAPICNPGSVALPNQRNRWTIALEVLTGSFTNYTCQEQPRNDPARLDFNYYIPHYRPFDPARPASLPIPFLPAQDTNGIMDQYRERVRFGLMTFDSYAGQPDFAGGERDDATGMWSYGDDARIFCAGCIVDFTWNAGARNDDADEGALVSHGPANDRSITPEKINDEIQAELLEFRPYWATPIAAMIDDADYYYENHRDANMPPDGNDPWDLCRKKYALLVTDGAPNVDGRPFCERGGCECPWLPANEEAMELYNPLGAISERRPLLVVGYDVQDLATRRILWEVAVGGGTALDCDDLDLCPGGDPSNCGSVITCPIDAEHPGAMFAGCRDVDAVTCASRLRTAISSMLDWIAGDSTTRTRPAFTNAVGFGSHGQYQFNTTFRVAAGSPWMGTLQRNRFECDGSDPVAVPFDADEDDFGVILNTRNLAARPRNLVTFLPAGNPGEAEVRRTLVEGDGFLQDFTKANGAITGTVLGGIDDARRDATIDWMHGEAGSARARARLGDIYHSNPAILGPPDLNLPDMSFRLFKEKEVGAGGETVAERPTILYVGTNDGILHAFDASTGEELWGFVPPYLLPVLEEQVPSAHRFGVDGGVLARDVLLGASPATLPTEDDWRTVVVFGLRQGGNAYVALDVTDWENPQFLWQFAPPELGLTYSAPQIGTVFVKEGGTTVEKAVAVLAGGAGTLGAGRNCPRGGAGLDPAYMRGTVRCWNDLGRYLWIVDLETGDVVKEFGPRDFDAPLVGTPALFQSQHGTSLRRVFVTDTEGTLYRVHTGFTDPTNWRVDRLFDLYHGGRPADSVPSFEEPLLTVNEAREVVIVYGSGDPDDLASTTEARVASITEKVTLDASGLMDDVEPDVNWEMDLPDRDEKLTGPMQLFDGALYFTTFIPSQGNPNDACATGYGRIWGVDVILTEGGRGLPAPRWDEDGDIATDDFVRYADLADNTVVFGVGITRRPSCAEEENFEDDFGRTRTRLTDVTPGEYKLVIQSGLGSPGPGWEPGAAGGSANVFERSLQPPDRPINVLSWTNIIEE